MRGGWCGGKNGGLNLHFSNLILPRAILVGLHQFRPKIAKFSVVRVEVSGGEVK